MIGAMRSTALVFPRAVLRVLFPADKRQIVVHDRLGVGDHPAPALDVGIRQLVGIETIGQGRDAQLRLQVAFLAAPTQSG